METKSNYVIAVDDNDSDSDELKKVEDYSGHHLLTEVNDYPWTQT